MSPNRNTIWARALVDELARAGLREAAIAPGSRSTPLVLALHDHPQVRTRTILDERSAAFFALGVGKATGVPAAVVTTSGTAVANLFPAVVEAAWSETPLLLLTADRPPRLRGTDANQTIDQQRIFGAYPRDFFDLEEPVVQDRPLRSLRETACRAVAACLGLPAGPVHLNIPFDKPLEPTPVPGDMPEGVGDRSPLAAGGRPDGVSFREVEVRRPAPDRDQVEGAAELLRSASRGLVVAGPVAEPWRVGPALRTFSRATGYPLLPDPLSGGRYGPEAGEVLVGGYDLLLRGEDGWTDLAPELVVRVGRFPTSATLAGFLESRPGRTILLDAGGLWEDHLGLVTDRISADPVLALEALADALEEPSADADWAAAWLRADEKARRAIRAQLDGPFFEGAVLAEVLAAAGPGAGLFVGSSMPIRDLDAFGPSRPEPLLVMGNRGASGIDGSISTALGMAEGLELDGKNPGEPLVAVVGDVAFLHDLNGLLAARELERPVVLVVINNDGGGIFHMLPVREHEPAFTRHFAAPHGLELRHAGALHGLAHRRLEGSDGGPPSPGDFRQALRETIREAREEGGTRILEVVSGREDNRRRREEVVAAVRRALAENDDDRGRQG